MSYLVFTHAAGREVYGDEPRYSEEYLCGDEQGVDDNNLIERRITPPQFGADGRLILARNTDPTRGTGLAAFMDCLTERRPYCALRDRPPAMAMREAA
jgi:hypothetical protein